METLTVTVSETLFKEVPPYPFDWGELLRLGLRQVKMEQALALFKQGGISFWRAARLAGVSLREMAQYAVAQGMRATVDDETIREELVYEIKRQPSLWISERLCDEALAQARRDSVSR